MKVHDQQVVGEGSGTSRDHARTGNFTLDTSGVVHGNPHIIGPDGQHYAYVTWGILSSFEQGYTRKALEDFAAQLLADGWSPADVQRLVRFHHLAPETPAAIKKDCAAYEQQGRACGLWTGTPEQGRAFWTWRATSRDGAFPPVHLFVGDDGKVYARVSA